MEIVPTERPNAYVLRVDGADQSHVDLDDPTRLEFDYVRRMGDVLDAWQPAGEPLRIVHVGGAAMTLPRYVAATRPRSSQIVLEPVIELTELVRSALPVPRRSGIKVRPVDGRAGTAELREGSADVVILDAFTDARVPADLVTAEYFESVSRALTDSGCFLLNLTDRAPFAWTRRVVTGLRTVLPQLIVSAEPATLRGCRFGNLLAVASRTPLPVTSLRQRASSSAAPYRVLDAAQVSSSLGGGTPFTDDDTRPSPLPQDR